MNETDKTSHADGERQLSPRAHRVLNVLCALMATGLTVWLLVFLYVTRDWPVIHDAPLYHYVGWQVTAGGVPYRDVVDMSFPGTYMLHWALVSISSDYDTVWQVFHVAVLGGVLLLIGLFLRPRKLASVWAGCLSFGYLYISFGPLHTGQRDMIAAFLLILALYLLARFLERGAAGLPRVLAAGVFLGAALVIRPAAIVTVALAGLFVLVRQWPHHRSVGRTAATAGVAAVGMAIPVAGVFAWIYALGAFPYFLEDLFQYTVPIYSKYASSMPRVLVWDLLPELPFNFLLLAGGVIGLAAVAARRVDDRLGLILAGFVGGLAHFLIQRKGFHYHLFPLGVFGTILVCWHLGGLMASRGARRWATGVALCGWICVPLAVRAKSFQEAWRPRYARVQEIVSYVRPRLAPQDRIQVLDTTEGGLNVLLRLGRKQPTRIIYDFMLFKDDPNQPFVRKLREDFLRNMEATPPKYVLFFRVGWPGGAGYERINEFDKFATWFDKNYEIVKERPDYRIYGRRP